MLTLLTFPGEQNFPSLSSFCLKTMCLLTMADEDWRPEFTTNTSAMPHGKLPALRSDDRLIPDSEIIETWLESRGADFYAGLSGQTRAQGQAIIRMVEESLQFGLVHDRWLDEECWPHLRAVLFAEVPRMIRPAVSSLVRRQVRKDLMSNGIARFSVAQRRDRLARELDVLVAQLGDKAFMLSDRPSVCDASAGPVLDMLAALPADTALRRAVRDRPTLMHYTARVRAAIYPDLDDLADRPRPSAVAA